MSTKVLLIECGAAETRAAFLIDGNVWRLWSGPARGDETSDQTIRPGRRYVGKITSINKALEAAFLDIGAHGPAFLPIKKTYSKHVVEGARLNVEVKTPPRQGKGALLKFVGCSGDGAQLGPVDDPDDAVVSACLHLGESDGEVEGGAQIVIDDGDAATLLRRTFPVLDIVHENRADGLFHAHGLETVFDDVFDREVSLVGGGALVIDEAQALTAIDVDTQGLSGSSPARLREKISFAAAKEAARQISLRNIGGHIVVDFPSLQGDAARKRFRDFAIDTFGTLDGAGAFSFSKSGLFSFTAPHRRPSFLERWTEEVCNNKNLVGGGRQYTTEWIGICAIRAAEQGLSATLSAHIVLSAGQKLYAFLQERPHWFSRLADRFGARLELKINQEIDDNEYRITET